MTKDVRTYFTRDMILEMRRKKLESESVLDGIYSITLERDFPEIKLVPFSDFDFEICSQYLQGKSGLYALYGEHGYTLYIGKAECLESRIKQHLSGKSNTKEFSHEVRRIGVILCENKFLRELYETALIQMIKPIFNKAKAYYK